MGSSDEFAQPLQMIEASAAIVVDPHATPPFEASAGQLRKREGRFRSRVWQHFTRLEKKPGGRQECQCNHCGRLYACSSRHGTGNLNHHIFDGLCPNYVPSPSELRTRAVHTSDDFDDTMEIDTQERRAVDPAVTPTPFGSRVRNKPKTERRFRSRVWQHFTRLEKKPGEREECRCNHCYQTYAYSNRGGTGHLNRHIFDGKCPNYRPTPSESRAASPHTRDDFDDTFSSPPGTQETGSLDKSIDKYSQENLEQLQGQLSRLEDENAKLQQEKEGIIRRKESLEQLLVTMASETARLTEENAKLKEDRVKLQEEKQKIVMREEFTRLEAQVSKLREDFEKDRRGYPSSILASLAQIQKNK